jgi:ABC-2 type transport system permease protein
MSGAFAIFERDFRKFLKSPVMMFMTLLFPLFYLIILGNAIGGTIHHIPIGMTQTDLFYGETQEFQTTLEAIQQTDLFDVTIYPSEEIAKRDLAEGRIYAAAVFPADRNDANTIRVYIDSSDSFVPPLIENGFSGIVHGLGISRVVESYQIYGKVEYLQFFGVAILVMSIFMTSMMGGGNALIRDRENGIIEGYYVTPVKRSSILLGIIMSGSARAMLTSSLLLIVDVLVAGVIIRSLENFLLVIAVLLLISVSITSFVVSFASRFPNQQTYASTVGFFNLLLFMTSGAFYPTIAMPDWLRWITVINPEYYAVHALRSILLKGQGLAYVGGDLLAIAIFSIAAITFGILGFKRTLE